MKLREPIKYQDILAYSVMAAIIIHSYIKGIDMTETYKAVMMAIVMYYFGSSKSSSNKDETIRSLQDEKKTGSVVGETVETQNITVKEATITQDPNFKQ